MKAAEFDYVRAESVDHACRLLAEADGEARPIAGGQTLVPLMAMRLVRPALLVDIGSLEALQRILADDEGLSFGAATRQETARRDAAVRRQQPLLAKALGFVGHIQIRNRGTVGGSLANADPAAEIGLACLVLDGSVTAESTGGRRRIELDGFFTGAMSTALAPAECLTSIRLPAWSKAGRLGTGFQEISVRHGDFALAAAAAQLQLDGDGTCTRLAAGLGGVEAMPRRLPALAERLVGTRLEVDDIAAAVADVGAGLDPLSDQQAGADYRRRVAGPLLARAIAEARDEALSGRT